MKIFKLNHTYLTPNQFRLFGVIFWIVIIAAILVMKHYGVGTYK